ncbi:hypothetical protein GYA54_02345 [Candidatus Kuenenbacteria bacterium]|nr:hypothetical protein [Candidatus Kuenenbacteria bacterium]
MPNGSSTARAQHSILIVEFPEAWQKPNAAQVQEKLGDNRFTVISKTPMSPGPGYKVKVLKTTI